MRERWQRVVAACRRWLAPRRSERDLHDEIAAYADMLADEQQSAGVSPDEARRLARVEVGGVETVKESVRDIRAGLLVEQTLQDVRYALRGLRRTPGFTTAAIATLALGLGANTAMFSVVDATLIKPLPYRDAGRLVNLGHLNRAGTPDEITIFDPTWTEIEFWRGKSQIFEGVESYDSRSVPIDDADTGAPVQVARLTPGMPALLGLFPQLGRVFTVEEAKGAASVALISDTFWRRRFNASNDAIGSTIRLGKDSLTVVGVMPPQFRYGPGTSGVTDVWRPLAGDTPSETLYRLRAPLDRTSAIPALQVAATRLQAIQPARSPWTPALESFDQRRENATRKLVDPLGVLLAMTVMVVIVVCANLGNLWRVRLLNRGEELAMRVALGAGRARIVRLLLVEVGVVVGLGAIAGALLAAGAIKILPSVLPQRLAYSLFIVSLPALDVRVAAFGMALLALVASVTIVIPALRAIQLHRLATTSTIDERARRAPGKPRAIAWLQAFQMALALLLVTASTLVAGSFIRLKTADLGFDSQRLYSMSFALPIVRYAEYEAQQAWYARVLDRVRHLPGVTSAAFGTAPPTKSQSRLSHPGDAIDDSLVAARRNAGEGYFRTAGVPLLEGREFNSADRAGSEPVAIVSVSAARALWPGQSAVGQLAQTTISSKMPPARVVGVVGDVAAYDFTAAKALYGLYLPSAQELSPNATILVRAIHDGPSIIRDVEGVMRAEEPAVRITLAGPVTMYYDTMETYAGPRSFAMLVASFAVLALVTAAVGLYGLLAYIVSRRQREIGVRVALGSTIGQIRSLVLVDALRPVAIGAAIGLAGSWVLARYLASLLYGVSPHDPIAFAAGGLILTVAAGLATLGPVRKATGVDPIRALRVE